MSNDNDHLEQARYRLEEVTLISEGLKHLTTLATGSIVLLATFLKDIFPQKNGVLAVGGNLKLLIAMSFVFLGISLITSILYIVMIAPPGIIAIEVEQGMSEIEEEQRVREVEFQAQRRRFVVTYYARLLSASVFVLGILCFGAAVLINLNVF